MWRVVNNLKFMDKNIIPQGPHKDFESIKHIDENGIEYWLARDLMLLLGYPHWQKAEEVIGRAARACLNSGQNVDNHFNRTVKMVKIGSNTVRKKVLGSSDNKRSKNKAMDA